MNRLKLNIKSEHLIILFIAFLAFINYSYHTNIYKKYHGKNLKLKVKLIETTNKIYEEINKFNNEISIFDKLKIIKNKAVEKEYEIAYLKNKIKSKKDILSIFRTLVLQTKVNFDKIELISDKITKNTGTLMFRFKGSSTVNEFIYLLDTIENRNEFFIVNNFKLKAEQNKLDYVKIEMVIKFVYLAL